jgi:hypothetical protein
MLREGTILHTRDGRNIGNGIIISAIELDGCAEPKYAIKTDFGNIINLYEYEIPTLFYIGDRVDSVEQLYQQIRLLYKNFNSVLRG